MSLVQIIAILGTIPLFSLRTFLPAFLTALLLAYPQYFPGMGDVPPLGEDAFITRDWVLITLGILSLLEIIGDKSTAIRNLMKNAETYLKPAFFLIINLNLLDEASTEVLKDIQFAAFDPGYILLAFGALVVHWLATLRRDFISFLEDIDEDDNFFIGKISSWVEDSLVLFGFMLLIWTGIFMVLLYFLGIVFFVFLRKRYDRKIEEQKISCVNCGEKNLPYAVKCYNCKTLQPQIHAIGVLGQRRERLVTSVKKHQIELIAHRKCPDCGIKLKSHRLYQDCEVCGKTLFKSPEISDFVKYQDKRFYKLIGLSILLGFIPVVGFLVSAVLANIYLFSPYRKYVPKASSFVTKIFIKFLTFLLFLLGIALGFIAAPVYIIMRYYIWKRKFLSLSGRRKVV